MTQKRLTLLVVTLGTILRIADASQPPTILIDDPRPLSKAAELLERQYGVPIGYEDPAWTYIDDLRDVTDPSFKKDHPEAQILIPRGGQFTIPFESVAIPKHPGRTALPDVESRIQDIIQLHSLNVQHGTFKLVKSSEHYSIVPAVVRDRTGDNKLSAPLLDTAITIPFSKQDGLTGLQAICDAIGKVQSYRIVLGTIPPDLAQKVATFGANQEIARNVLARLLDELQWADSTNTSPLYYMSWRVLYSPDTRNPQFFLNVHVVVHQS